MNSRILIIVTVLLLAFVLGSCVVSEISWSMKEATPDSLRQMVGLPSVAVGNLNPSARNPGVELLCTGLYDIPGGYCNYFTMGVPFTNFSMPLGFSLVNNFNESGSGK
jgi:hypothetical protein